jgi:excisionase family DNA binding protein
MDTPAPEGQFVVKSSGANEVLTLEEAAALLRLCTKTVSRMAAAGQIPARRLSPKGPWRFNRSKLLEWCNGDRAA